PHREHRPVDAERPADTGHRRTADVLGEPVVASATADRTLGTEAVVHELERRARVVVEPPHEPWRLRPRDPEVGEVPAYGVVVRTAVVAEGVTHDRCVGD